MELAAAAAPAPEGGGSLEASGLTGRQTTILSAIGQYYEATSEPCPASYLARRLSLDHSTVREHLARLHRKGWLRAPNTPAVPSRFLRG